MIINNKSNRRLAVFDVEGIIIPKRQFLLLQAIKTLKINKILTVLLQGFLYELGIYPLDRALRGIYRFLNGVSQEEVSQTFNLIPIIPGVRQVFEKLKKMGYQIALISSGIPEFLVKELATKLNVDYAYGLKLEVIKGVITGNISGDVIKKNGKALILEKILKEEKYSKKDCIAIVDDRNNLSLLHICEKSIGYNPDTIIAAKCDYAIKGELEDIIPFLDPTVKKLTIPYTRTDIFREIIHLGSFLIPILSQFLNINRYILAIIILLTTILYTVSEFKRRIGTNFPLFTRLTKMAIMGAEKWGFADAPIFFALGIFLTLILYPKQIGYAAITMLTLGDGTAKIIGKKFGTISFPYNKAKKLEGTVAGIIAATIGSLLFVSPQKALIVATLSMIVESIPLPINDNIIIPLVAGTLLMIMP